MFGLSHSLDDVERKKKNTCKFNDVRLMCDKTHEFKPRCVYVLWTFPDRKINKIVSMQQTKYTSLYLD